MKKRKNKIAQEQKVQEQYLNLNINGSTISKEVAQKALTSLLDNMQLYHHKI